MANGKQKNEVQKAFENDAFRARVERAAEILGLTPQTLATKLVNKPVGAKTVELLVEVTFGDLMGIPVDAAPARAALKVLHGEQAASPGGEPEVKVVSSKKAAAMTAQQLVSAYDPREADNAVGERLRTMSTGKRFVVFAADGRVDVDASVKLLGELRDGYPERDMYVESGKDPRQVYSVGDRPGQMADENPLYPGRLLRPDGTCDQTNRGWDGVPHPVRVLLRLAVQDTREIVVQSIDQAHNVLDVVMGEGAEQKLRSRCARAVLKYIELEEQGKLPTLKVPRGSGSGDCPVDPFHRDRGDGHRTF